jgi:hypothetical protein
LNSLTVCCLHVFVLSLGPLCIRNQPRPRPLFSKILLPPHREQLPHQLPDLREPTQNRGAVHPRRPAPPFLTVHPPRPLSLDHLGGRWGPRIWGGVPELGGETQVDRRPE